MNTSVYLDELDVFALQKKYDNSFLKVFRERVQGELPIQIEEFIPIKNRKLFALTFPLDDWKKLQHWIVDNTTEMYKPNIRDAMLTLLGVER